MAIGAGYGSLQRAFTIGLVLLTAATLLNKTTS